MFSAKEYELEFFKAHGFERQKCKKCEKFFWSTAQRETCGEPPCDEYTFIGNKVMKKKFSLGEMREFYLTFFEQRDHTRIHRYPVVARWRDDTFFTIASISCFQPWVLAGEVEPPANPLTISQPCIRFNDIDNVGKTGRHLTMFEMMAHHAFNVEGKFIYFKDKTVQLCNDLLLSLGIPQDSITYIESEWSGGGNSGPCFEAVVAGVELATLVFMMYEDTPSGKKEMRMKVVDTGYGLERFVWLSQGKENVYECIFPDLLKRLKNYVAIQKIDPKILAEYSRIAGLMNVETHRDLRELRRRVSEKVSIAYEDLVKLIEPYENLYALLDHTRALTFMLNDGVVPSNVREGYFARLLIRRSLRAMKKLNLDLKLSDVISFQIDSLARDFKDIKDNASDIIQLVDIEEERYERTVKKGREIVSKFERERKLDLDALIELYDTYGLTPDLVAEFSARKIEIPDDFYIQVAKRHEAAKKVEKKPKLEIPQEIKETKLLYYENPEMKRFKAKVIKKVGNYIILDKTCFYPEGGGQESDKGKISKARVKKVFKMGNVVVHEVENPELIRENEEVECEIDYARRFQLMQHHTATHIINGAARRVLGNHVWQAGAHKSESIARLDITHHSSLTKEEIKAIEDLSNKVVKEKRKVIIEFLERNKAEQKYGFRIYQGGVVPGKILRIVTIENWDTEACGGTHLSNTADVGEIKIIRAKRIQDGVIRLEFKAGKAAEKYKKEIEAIGVSIAENLSPEDLEEISKLFSVPIEKIPHVLSRFKKEYQEQIELIRKLETKLHQLGIQVEESKKYESFDISSKESAKKLFYEWKKQRKSIEKLQRLLAEYYTKNLKDILIKNLREDTAIVVVYGVNPRDLRNIVTSLALAKNVTVVVLDILKDNPVLFVSSNKINSFKLANKIVEIFGGKVKGDEKFAMGGIKKIPEEEEFLGYVANLVKNLD